MHQTEALGVSRKVGSGYLGSEIPTETLLPATWEHPGGWRTPDTHTRLRRWGSKRNPSTSRTSLSPWGTKPVALRSP